MDIQLDQTKLIEILRLQRNTAQDEAANALAVANQLAVTVGELEEKLTTYRESSDIPKSIITAAT